VTAIIAVFLGVLWQRCMTISVEIIQANGKLIRGLEQQ